MACVKLEPCESFVVLKQGKQYLEGYLQRKPQTEYEAIEKELGLLQTELEPWKPFGSEQQCPYVAIPWEGRLARGLVFKVTGQIIDVFLLDYGLRECFVRDSAYKLPLKFQKLPIYGLRVALDSPVETNLMDSTTMIHSLVRRSLSLAEGSLDEPKPSLDQKVAEEVIENNDLPSKVESLAVKDEATLEKSSTFETKTNQANGDSSFRPSSNSECTQVKTAAIPSRRPTINVKATSIVRAILQPGRSLKEGLNSSIRAKPTPKLDSTLTENSNNIVAHSTFVENRKSSSNVIQNGTSGANSTLLEPDLSAANEILISPDQENLEVYRGEKITRTKEEIQKCALLSGSVGKVLQTISETNGETLNEEKSEEKPTNLGGITDKTEPTLAMEIPNGFEEETSMMKDFQPFPEAPGSKQEIAKLPNDLLIDSVSRPCLLTQVLVMRVLSPRQMLCSHYASLNAVRKVLDELEEVPAKIPPENVKLEMLVLVFCKATLHRAVVAAITGNNPMSYRVDFIDIPGFVNTSTLYYSSPVVANCAPRALMCTRLTKQVENVEAGDVVTLLCEQIVADTAIGCLIETKKSSNATFPMTKHFSTPIKAKL